MRSPCELLALRLFETAAVRSVNDVRPLQLDIFGDVCLAACAGELSPMWFDALYRVTMRYLRALRMYVTECRRQQYLTLAWLALGALVIMRDGDGGDDDDDVWYEQRAVAAFADRRERAVVTTWTLAECRTVTRALALDVVETPCRIFFAPAWWRGFERLHARCVQLCLAEQQNNGGDDDDDAAADDDGGVTALECELASVHMDFHWLRVGLSAWRASYDVMPVTLDPARASCAVVTRWLEALTHSAIEERTFGLAGALPARIRELRISHAILPGDVAATFRAGTLSGRIEPVPCLQICRPEAVFAWWNAPERTDAVHDVLLRDRAGGIELENGCERGLYLFHLVDQYFTCSAVRFPWMSAVVTGATALITPDANRAPLGTARIVHCGAGFFVAMHGGNDGAHEIVMCDDAMQAIAVWLTAVRVFHAARYHYDGRTYDLSEVLDAIFAA